MDCTGEETRKAAGEQEQAEERVNSFAGAKCFTYCPSSDFEANLATAVKLKGASCTFGSRIGITGLGLLIGSTVFRRALRSLSHL
jgi:hypothetical protein